MRTDRLSKPVKWALAGALLSVIAVAPAPAAPAGATQVDMKLILATDVSRSINNEEARIQREGIADAFANPDVIKSIQSGALGRIAIAMIDWSSPDLDRVVLDWTIVKDKASAIALSEKIRALPRTRGRRTSISSVLELGALLLESSDKDIVGTRRVIDVSGDGPNNDGNPLKEVHDQTVANGIIVNGLPIMDENANGYFPDLDKYYQGCVVGGRGSFVVVVKSFADFGAAMRHKLILEISQDEQQIKQALNELHAESPFKLTAVGDAPAQPQVLRPNTAFQGSCDLNGFGFGGF